jgi:hypothetical protein
MPGRVFENGAQRHSVPGSRTVCKVKIYSYRYNTAFSIFTDFGSKRQ